MYYVIINGYHQSNDKKSGYGIVVLDDKGEEIICLKGKATDEVLTSSGQDGAEVAALIEAIDWFMLNKPYESKLVFVTNSAYLHELLSDEKEPSTPLDYRTLEELDKMFAFQKASVNYYFKLDDNSQEFLKDAYQKAHSLARFDGKYTHLLKLERVQHLRSELSKQQTLHHRLIEVPASSVAVKDDTRGQSHHKSVIHRSAYIIERLKEHIHLLEGSTALSEKNEYVRDALKASDLKTPLAQRYCFVPKMSFESVTTAALSVSSEELSVSPTVTITPRTTKEVKKGINNIQHLEYVNIQKQIKENMIYEGQLHGNVFHLDKHTKEMFLGNHPMIHYVKKFDAIKNTDDYYRMLSYSEDALVIVNWQLSKEKRLNVTYLKNGKELHKEYIIDLGNGRINRGLKGDVLKMFHLLVHATKHEFPQKYIHIVDSDIRCEDCRLFGKGVNKDTKRRRKIITNWIKSEDNILRKKQKLQAFRIYVYTS